MRSALRRSANLANYQKATSSRKNNPTSIKNFSHIVDIVNEILIDIYDEKIEKKRLDVLMPRVQKILEDKELTVPGVPIDKLAQNVSEALTGYGQIHHLIADPSITNIIVVNYNLTFIMKNLRWRPIRVDFGSEQNLREFVRRVVSRLGGRYTLSSPIANVEDEDFNLRIRATGFDISPDSPKLFIRRLSNKPLTEEQVKYAMSDSIRDFIDFCVKAKFNIGIAGTYGSGKTSLLQKMISNVPPNLHVALIQSANEIQEVHPFLTRLFTRDLVGENGKKINESDLLMLVKQITPQVLALGEFLGEEAHTMVHILQQGIQSFYTFHANDPEGAIHAYNYMVQMSGNSSYTQSQLIEESAKYNDIMIIMDRLRVRELVQFTGNVVNGAPEYKPIFKFKVNEETAYELKGFWEKEPGVVLCDKLMRKASLAGVTVPNGFRREEVLK
ncbi:Putative conjugal transfer protein Rv3659c [Bacillus subtilis]|uniref:ATPase, T2SS/T4P/T4SS family n=1 Tax=Bacillus subtilis group TaxID=653685 RepID=UPI0011A45CB3|nr:MULTISPECIES: ATPase, T2SS/T4P/T4SS family [Bacillus subtilis group]CAF1783325.1 Putative conjugal transfer protein Rv3659c [Bacillus subtilis]CAF1786658.1 Putative conjugal transfer protein Rv3659c [Bacillus subtilis]CAI6331373.1 CpaF family protein [Bacillus subtilis]